MRTLAAVLIALAAAAPAAGAPSAREKRDAIRREARALGYHVQQQGFTAACWWAITIDLEGEPVRTAQTCRWRWRQTRGLADLDVYPRGVTVRAIYDVTYPSRRTR